MNPGIIRTTGDNNNVIVGIYTTLAEEYLQETQERFGGSSANEVVELGRS